MSIRTILKYKNKSLALFVVGIVKAKSAGLQKVSIKNAVPL